MVEDETVLEKMQREIKQMQTLQAALNPVDLVEERPIQEEEEPEVPLVPIITDLQPLIAEYRQNEDVQQIRRQVLAERTPTPEPVQPSVVPVRPTRALDAQEAYNMLTAEGHWPVP